MRRALYIILGHPACVYGFLMYLIVAGVSVAGLVAGRRFRSREHPIGASLNGPGRMSGSLRSMAAAVTTHQLRKVFDDVVAVAGLDLTIEPGTVFGLLGSNGAGKSTFTSEAGRGSTFWIEVPAYRPVTGELAVVESPQIPMPASPAAEGPRPRSSSSPLPMRSSASS